MECFDLRGRGDDEAEVGEVGDCAVAEGLGEDVAQGGGFVRAHVDGAGGGVGGHLVEQRIAAAAADEVEAGDPRACELFESVEGVAGR